MILLQFKDTSTACHSVNHAKVVYQTTATEPKLSKIFGNPFALISFAHKSIHYADKPWIID